MEVIRYFSVSIFLFCDQIKSDELNALSLQKTLMSLTFAITSAENDKLSNFFPKSRIPTFLRSIPNEYFEPLNDYDSDLDEKNSSEESYNNPMRIASSANINPMKHDLNQIIDNVLNCNDDINKTIYDSVVFLFVDKWEQLHSEDNLLIKYPSNLGYEKKTMNLINRAMTELMYLQRKDHILVNQLASAYLYSCDLENTFKMDKREDEKKNNEIRTQFIEYLTKYRYYRDELKKEEDRKVFIIKIEKTLEDSLNTKTIKVKTSFNITVKLIKNWTLITKTDNKTVIALQNKNIFIDFDENTSTFSDIVLSWSVKNNFPEAIENHLFVLKQVILHFYAFVTNHVELSAELCDANLNENDMKIIDGFRTFMYFFIPLFVDRFFELNKLLDKNFIEKLLKLLEFMFPDSDDKLMDKLSIHNYKVKITNRNISLRVHILNLSDSALDALLVLTEVKDKTNWKKERAQYIENYIENDSSDKKKEIFKLINNNFVTAMNALVLFILDYDMGLKLFDESPNESTVTILEEMT